MSELGYPFEAFEKNHRAKQQFVGDFLRFAARVNWSQSPYSHGTSREAAIRVGAEQKESNVSLWILKDGPGQQGSEQWMGKMVIYTAVAGDVMVDASGNTPPDAQDVLLRVTSQPPAVYVKMEDNLVAVEPRMTEWQQVESIARMLMDNEQSLTRPQE